MEKLLGVNWRTNLVGFFWVGYGIAELYMHRAITEFGFLAVFTGAGFLAAKDKQNHTSKDELTK